MGSSAYVSYVYVSNFWSESAEIDGYVCVGVLVGHDDSDVVLEIVDDLAVCVELLYILVTGLLSVI